MTDEQKELLKLKAIKEEWEGCYITADNQVFEPVKDDGGNITKTAEEKYNEMSNSQTPEPTLEERLASAEEMLSMIMGV